MKNKIITAIIIFMGIISLYNIKSEATFKITDFQINCSVEANGDIQIKENIEYYTNEDKNGLIRTIDTKNSQNTKNSADELIFQEVLVDGNRYSQTYGASVGDNGVYTLKESGNSTEIKVFTPFYATTKKITYKYKLTNVAVKYEDIAELYWNFIGSEWDCPIENLEINIVLPASAASGTIYVYGHGSDNGTFTKNGNYITLRASDLNAYQALDARILFPRDSISTSTKIINKKVLDKYINQEEGVTAKREQPSLMFGLSVNKIALITSGIIVFVGVIIYIKYDKEYKVEKYQYYREIPYNLEPEILQRIYYGKETKDAFWITFLNLIKKGVFKIEKTTNEVGKETENIIYVKDVENLKPYQDTVRKTIKIFMPIKDMSIDLLELQSKMKNSISNTYKDFKRNLDNEIEGLFGETQKAPKKLTIILAIGMVALIAIIVLLARLLLPGDDIVFGIAIFLGLTAFVYSLLFATVEDKGFVMVFLLFHCAAFQVGNILMLTSAGLGIMYIPYILLFILIQYVVRVRKSSKEERQIREQVKGLRRYLRDYSYLSEKEEINEIALWEDYFILAIALGLNNRVIDNWYRYGQNFTQSNLETSLYCVGGYSHISSNIKPVFRSYVSSAYALKPSGGSSYSGSSGGFSGGSSSGGGGRRWRRRQLLLMQNGNSGSVLFLPFYEI